MADFTVFDFSRISKADESTWIAMPGVNSKRLVSLWFVSANSASSFSWAATVELSRDRSKGLSYLNLC